MTRDSKAWRWIGFLIALVGVGFPYWQLAPEDAGLPRALYGPGLVAVGVIAMLSLPEQADCGFELPTLPFREPTPTSPAALAATGASDPAPIVVLAIGTAVAGAALIGAARLRSRRR